MKKKLSQTANSALAKNSQMPAKKKGLRSKSEATTKPEQQIPSTSDQRADKRHRWIMNGSVIAAALLVLGVSVGAVNSYQEPEPEVEIVEEEPEPEEEPEEELPTENPDDLVPQPEVTDYTAYQVAAYKPRYMTISSIGLYNIPVVEIGIGGGTLGDPDDYRLIGWQYDSALPGQQGVAMIDGHGGGLGNGIFRNLPNVPVGGDIIVEMGDGRKFTYRVVEKVYKTKGAQANAYMHTAYQSPREGVPAMTLITCTGDWIRAEQTYTHRLFVRAILVQS